MILLNYISSIFILKDLKDLSYNYFLGMHLGLIWNIKNEMFMYSDFWNHILLQINCIIKEEIREFTRNWAYQSIDQTNRIDYRWIRWHSFQLQSEI